MKRILVTGAGGFVGRTLVCHLAAQGFTVRAASRMKLTAIPGVEPIEMPDLARTTDWAPLLSGVDAIVHAAAIAHANCSDDAIYDAINHRAVLALARAAHGKVERLVFLSSIRAQCGDSADAILTEIDEPHPVDAYGRSKLRAEEGLGRLGAPAVVLRPVLVAGRQPKGNLATMLRLAKLPLPLPFGALRARRSLLASADLNSAIVHVLDSARHIGSTYIVAHPDPISISAMFGALRDGLGRQPHLVPVNAPFMRGALVLSGRRIMAGKLFGDLIASPGKLMATGWVPGITPGAALADLAGKHR